MQLLQSATLAGTHDYIYPQDPAIDQERFTAEEFEAALETNDMGRIKAMCHEGQEPTVWQLKHLTGNVRRFVLDQAMASQTGRVSFVALRRIASVVLAGVTNLHGPGGPVAIRQSATDPETKLPCVPSQQMDQLDAIDQGNLVSAIALRAINTLGASKN